MQLERESVFFLRIKREYMDRIERGEKTIEYRSVVPSYARLLDPRTKFLVLHYQQSRRLLVQIKHVEIIPLPERLKASTIRFTPTVYAIHLGKSRLISE